MQEGASAAASEYALGSRAEKRGFYRYTVGLITPIALQNLMNAAVDSADVVLLSFVGQNAMAAASLAGQVAFVMNMVLFGMSSCATVLGAQYWGKGDRDAVERVQGLVVRIALLVGAVFSLAGLAFPGVIMRFFTDNEALAEAGVEYLRAVGISYVLGSFATIYLSVQRAVERVRVSAAVHCIAVLMNVILNSCFIFGWGFFPKLGITGVALATSITRFAEAVWCVVDGRRCRIIKLRLKYILRRDTMLLRDFFRYSVPAILNDLVWGIAFSIYSVIFGHLSSDIVAASSVAVVVRNFGTVLCFGTSSGAAICMGKTMGEGRLREAEVYAGRFLLLAVLTALIGGGVILAVRPLVLRFMYLYVTVTDTVRSEVSTMLLIASYYIMGASVNTMYICGIFRAGGDVRFGLVMDGLSMWAYAVPMGLFCAFVLKLPEMWVYFIICLDEFVKIPFCIAHYRKKNWLRNITRQLG